MNVLEFVSLLMFVIVGGTLAHVGVGVMERPIPFFVIMLCMAVVKVIGLTR